MQINNLDFGNNLFLAPMAGVTDVGFREQCVKMGADVTCSEMLSARAMLYNSKKTELMTVISSLEKIKVGQIFGHEPQVLADAVRNPLLLNYDIIDINMGCPAPKIVKNGEGSALMKDIGLARKIIESVVKATQRPVSVKFRLGFDKDISCDFGRMCEEAGASFVTLHARTTEMGYSGTANYDSIAKLKANLKIPVVGNGDVNNIINYQNMLSTGVDGVMIGRGSQGKPWIFSEILGKSLTATDKFKVIQEHVQSLRKYYDENWLTLYLRKHFLWYTLGERGASEKRVKLATSPSVDESMRILAEIFNSNL